MGGESPGERARLERLNGLPDGAAREELLACCSSARWAAEVASGRPFASADELVARSDAAVAGLTQADLEQALAGHPRIGDRSRAAAADWSRQEQAGVEAADQALVRALADGNEDYERRLGHIYLVCATGRSAAELLAVLRERLGNDPAAEWDVVRRELGKINRIRLRRVLEATDERHAMTSAVTTHVLDTARGVPAAVARHFAGEIAPVSSARVEVEEYRWERVSVAGQPHPHTFKRTADEVRTTAVTALGTGGRKGTPISWVVSGLKDLVVLKSTGSEFSGFLRDRYTTLAETSDRILATSLTARWRYATNRRLKSWDEAYEQIRQVLLEGFATLHSLALQQTLFEMGRAALEARDDVAEIRLSAPNKHHFLADLSPFGLDNPGEVFHAANRPYGLIQCAVQRDDAEDPVPAWDSATAFEG